jgi:hypothetical protein
MALIVMIGFTVCGYFLWKQSVTLDRIEKMLLDRESGLYADKAFDGDLPPHIPEQTERNSSESLQDIAAAHLRR